MEQLDTHNERVSPPQNFFDERIEGTQALIAVSYVVIVTAVNYGRPIAIIALFNHS